VPLLSDGFSCTVLWKGRHLTWLHLTGSWRASSRKRPYGSRHNWASWYSWACTAMTLSSFPGCRGVTGSVQLHHFHVPETTVFVVHVQLLLYPSSWHFGQHYKPPSATRNFAYYIYAWSIIKILNMRNNWMPKFKTSAARCQMYAAYHVSSCHSKLKSTKTKMANAPFWGAIIKRVLIAHVSCLGRI
jgi:hypothetical protein